MAPRRVRLSAALAVGAVAISACGGGGDDPADPGATGAQGPSGAESTDVELTAEEFLPKLLPEKQAAIQGVIASEAACQGSKANPSLVLLVSDAASRASPDTPLTELVLEEC